MKGFILLCFILCLPNVTYAGLFDSVVSQVQQAAQQHTGQQQAAQQDQQQTTQQTEQQTQQTQSPPPEQAALKTQYGDFKWGMSMSEAKSLLLSKGKLSRSNDSIQTCQTPFPSDGEPEFISCYNTQFPDNLFNTSVNVNLFFTPKSKKLYCVEIDGLPTQGLRDDQAQTVFNSLDKKYGQHVEITSVNVWGDVKKGDRIQITPSGDGNEYSITYLDEDMIALAIQESEQQQQEGTQNISNEAASKL